MTTAQISKASDAEARQISNNLLEFNRSTIGHFDIEPVRLVAKVSSGQLVGGLNGSIGLSWLEIYAIWVDEEFRGKGIGASLLVEAERRAKDAGAKYANLDTFEWQAQDFYERFGYAEFGRLENCPPGSYRIFMSKEL